MNKVILSGRLTADPVITEGEKTVARFSIAVDKWNGEAEFFNVTAFAKTAEFVEKYIKKGTKIYICGRLTADKWTDKTGKNVTSVKVIADEVEFGERKGEKKEAPKDWAEVPNTEDEVLPFNF